jgi:ParB-like chromosome segregation protein Spo0J
MLRGRKTLDPITVTESNGRFLIVDGHHRAVAAAVARVGIDAEVVVTSGLEAASWSIDAFARTVRSWLKW